MTTPDDKSLEIAAFRYRVIADAIEAVDEDGITSAVRLAAERFYVDPQGRRRRFGLRTVWDWLAAYRSGGLEALGRARRKDRGSLRAIPPEVFERAKQLRREVRSRATKTIIDILVREKRIRRGAIARSTLDRHLHQAGLSRLRLRSLGKKTYRRIHTEHPFELVVADFHHGPYVRVAPGEETLHRALLCAFIDHWSRYVPEGRYYLQEDFAALRFGFRRVLVGHGRPSRFYVDNGPCFQATRLHAACSRLEVQLVHSQPYQAEGRGVIERFNQTLKGQFEEEVKARDDPLTLTELNAYFEAWLEERYHREKHSETGEPPLDRFLRGPPPRPAPDLEQIDELLRLSARRTVHKKWSCVQVGHLRYRVHPSLRGRRVEVLYDPFDTSYVLVVFDGRVVERAGPFKPGEEPPEPVIEKPAGPTTDYLELLRRDYEHRVQVELAAVGLRSTAASPDLSLPDLVAEIERCRAAQLTAAERDEVSATWRKMRPIDPEAARVALESAVRRLGHGLHVDVYLETLKRHLVQTRTKAKKGPRSRED